MVTKVAAWALLLSCGLGAAWAQEGPAPAPESTSEDLELYRQGSLALHRQELAGAEQAFRRLLEAHPDSPLAPEALFWIGHVEHQTGRVERAHATYAELLARFPQSGWAQDAGERFQEILAVRRGVGEFEVELEGEDETAVVRVLEIAPEGFEVEGGPFPERVVVPWERVERWEAQPDVATPSELWLHNGDRLSGVIVGGDRESIRLRTSGGSVVLPHRRVVRVQPHTATIRRVFAPEPQVEVEVEEEVDAEGRVVRREERRVVTVMELDEGEGEQRRVVILRGDGDREAQVHVLRGEDGRVFRLDSGDFTWVGEGEDADPQRARRALHEALRGQQRLQWVDEALEDMPEHVFEFEGAPRRRATRAFAVQRAQPTQTDRVYLRNGDILSGALESVDGTSVRLKASYGDIRIDREQVTRIELRDPAPRVMELHRLHRELQELQPARRPFLGVALDHDQAGLVVGSVIEGSAAEAAGVQAGDRITRFGDHEVESMEDLQHAIGAHAIGDEVQLGIVRDGTPQVLVVTLGGSPATSMPAVPLVPGVPTPPAPPAPRVEPQPVQPPTPPTPPAPEDSSFEGAVGAL